MRPRGEAADPGGRAGRTKLDVGVEAASATGEANRILVAVLAATQAGP